MASGIRRVRGHNGLRARDAAHGHTAVVAVIFVWTVFIVVVHIHVVVLVVLVILAGRQPDMRLTASPLAVWRMGHDAHPEPVRIES